MLKMALYIWKNLDICTDIEFGTNFTQAEIFAKDLPQNIDLVKCILFPIEHAI